LHFTQLEKKPLFKLSQNVCFLHIKEAVADPIKLFFFVNKQFFRFSLVSLHVCYIEKKLIAIKKKNTKKKSFIGSAGRSQFCQHVRCEKIF